MPATGRRAGWDAGSISRNRACTARATTSATWTGAQPRAPGVPISKSPARSASRWYIWWSTAAPPCASARAAGSRPRRPRGALLVLSSDFAWLADAHETQLARLAARFDVWAIQIVDAAERALPEMGAACFHDMASGQRVWLDTGEPAVRNAARSAFADHLAGQAARLVRAGVRHQQVDSDADDLVALLAHG